MEDSKVDIIISHRAPGIHPPLYVAGSFSDPQWVPQQMDYTTGEDGINIFTKTVRLQPQQKYQYKFRVGESDWWILDETAATVTDESGNRNNLIEAPEATSATESAIQSPEASHDAASEEAHEVVDSNPISLETRQQTDADSEEPPRDADIEGTELLHQTRLGDEPDSSLTERHATATPDFVRTTIEVADTAAELDMSDTALDIPNDTAESKDSKHAKLLALDTADVTQKTPETPAHEVDEKSQPEFTQQPAAHPAASSHRDNLIPEFKFNNDEGLDIAGYTGGPDPVRLFAHECAGVYEDDEIPAVSETGSDNPANDAGHVNGNQDFNDPTLEQFPSSRDAIMSTVRKVSTSLNVDETTVEGIPISPVVGPQTDIVEFSGGKEEDLPSSPQQSNFLLPRNQSQKSLGEPSPSLQPIAEGAEEEEGEEEQEEEEEAEQPEDKVSPSDEDTKKEIGVPSTDAKVYVDSQAEEAKADEIAPVAEQAETVDDIVQAAREGESRQPRDVATTTEQGILTESENSGFETEQLSPLSKPVSTGAEDVPAIREPPAVSDDATFQDDQPTQEHLATGGIVAPEDQELSPLSQPVHTNIKDIPAIKEAQPTQDTALAQEHLAAGHIVAPEDQELSPLSKPVQVNVEDIPAIEQNLMTEKAQSTQDGSTFDQGSVPQGQAISPTSKPVLDGADEVSALPEKSGVKQESSHEEAIGARNELVAENFGTHEQAPGDRTVAPALETVGPGKTQETPRATAEEATPVGHIADVEQASAIEDSSATAQASTAEEKSAIEKASAIEETPSIVEEPTFAEETSATDETPTVDEEPIVKEASIGHQTAESDEEAPIHKDSPNSDNVSGLGESAALAEQVDGAQEHEELKGHTIAEDRPTTTGISFPTQDDPVNEESVTLEDDSNLEKDSDTVNKAVSVAGEADITDSSTDLSKDLDVEHSQATGPNESAPTTEGADSQDEGISLSKVDQDTLIPPKHDVQTLITVPNPSTKPDTDLSSAISAEDEGVVLKPQNGEDKSTAALQLQEPSLNETTTSEPEGPSRKTDVQQPNITDSIVDYGLDGKDSRSDALPAVAAPLSPQIVAATTTDIPSQDVHRDVSLGESNIKDVELLKEAEASNNDGLPKAFTPSEGATETVEPKSGTSLKDEADNAKVDNNADLPGAADKSYIIEPTNKVKSSQHSESLKDGETTKAAEQPSHSEEQGPRSIDTLLPEPGSQEPTIEPVATSSAAQPAQSGSLTKRAAARSAPVDRTGTPNSITDSHKEAAKGGNWFSAFFRLIFIDLFGGLVSRLCGGGRKT
ncbi:hypothetical protein BD289DRAFT_480716 [Coniella lustricola]|uniref:AMP-activated protein kinase glycogen-binding domain-containing protein n=1 Tax=Coniella lustricola TaxID=2025994 RepID=A0A2T3AET1_9PEZI|nr:hypothetical protein BD289DRAFT_480716 [Coniella lustricola]